MKKRSIAAIGLANLSIILNIHTSPIKPISGRVKRASTTETVDLGLIPGQVKPKIIKICIYSFPA